MGLIRRQLRKSAAGRRLLRSQMARSALPDYGALALWQVPPAAEAKRVLIVTSHAGWLLGATLESLVAAALRARGHEVHVLLCDGVLPACFECDLDLLGSAEAMAAKGSKPLCDGCTQPAAMLYRDLGCTVHHYGKLLNACARSSARELAAETPFEDIPKLRIGSLPIGEHAEAGTLRFYGRADLKGEAQAEPILRRYLEAALLTRSAVACLLDQHDFEVALFHHGIYVPQGIVGAVCRDKDVRVVNWNPIWRKQTFIFSHGDTYHHSLLSDPNSDWEHMPWDKAREQRLLDYLEKRRRGEEDWIWFQGSPHFDRGAIERETGVDYSKPVIGLLTNVLWDAQLHYPDRAFPDMLSWICETIEYFGKRPELQLLIRIHPAELRGSVPSRQPLLPEIEQRLGELPSNVHVIKPESAISTYAAMEGCDSVLIYGTKTGLELSAQGIPVIVAGEAWLRNKGIATDCSDRTSFFESLDELPLGKPLEAERLKRARQYAYHFIFERMIPLPCFEPAKNGLQARLAVPEREALLPGGMPGLDLILEGLLEGKSFILRDEST